MTDPNNDKAIGRLEARADSTERWLSAISEQQRQQTAALASMAASNERTARAIELLCRRAESWDEMKEDFDRARGAGKLAISAALALGTGVMGIAAWGIQRIIAHFWG